MNVKKTEDMINFFNFAFFLHIFILHYNVIVFPYCENLNPVPFLCPFQPLFFFLNTF